MYLIGEFSKINRISTKTLRYYDEINLLKPKYTDDFTGYRYYTSKQLIRLHKIINLKQMGLGLKEIKSILDDNVNKDEYFKERVIDVKQNIENLEKQLLKMKNYIENRQELATPIIKSLPEVIVASMRIIAPSYNSYFELIPQMGEEMQRQGAVCAKPAYCFNIYHDGEYKEKDIDVEVCEAVVAFCEPSEKVKYKRISTVEEAVCVLHKGSYESIRETYAIVFQWIDENGYKTIGLPRESYIDGIWNKEDDAEWLTEIQVPVGKES